MFSKILVANRGEVAVRIIRACKEMGIHTVAVYSEADKEALHTDLADESYCIGGPMVKDSYLNIDAILNIDEITKNMIESLSELEPFGEANPMPVFAFKRLKIASIRSLTDGKHLKLSLKSKNNTYVNAIGFNLGHFASEFTIVDKVDVAGNLEINSFNGVDSIQINLKDVMKSI